MNKQQLIALRDKLVAEMRTLLDLCTTENRALTTEEETTRSAKLAEVRGINAKLVIIDEQEQLEAQARSQAQQTSPNLTGKLSPEQQRAGEENEQHGAEFRDFGEFSETAIFNPNDSTLQKRTLNTANKRAASFGSTGILIPTKFMSTILEVKPQEAIIRPNATTMPANEVSPDSEVTMPVLNQSESKGMVGGVRIYHTEEGGTVTKSETEFRNVTLKPKEMMGLIDVTQKLLNNAAALGAYLQNKLRQAKILAEEIDFMLGNGVGKALGLYQTKAAVKITRATSAKISYADLLQMFAAIMNGGEGYVWIINPSAIVELGAIKDESGRLIWNPNLPAGIPQTILGIPVRFSRYAPLTGSQGDVALVKVDEYLIQDGSQLAIASDLGYSGTNFTNNKQTIKAVWNVDGQLPYDAPFKEGNTTFSPVILLK